MNQDLSISLQQTKLPFRIKFATFLSKLSFLPNSLALSLLTNKDRVLWNKHIAEKKALLQKADFNNRNTQADLYEFSADEENILNTLNPSFKKVLVLGSGAGRESIAFAKRGWEVTSVDHSSLLLNQLRKKALELGYSLPTCLKDLTAGFPLLESKFDLITFWGGTYFEIPDSNSRVELLKKCRYHLASEGTILIDIPTNVANADKMSVSWSPTESFQQGFPSFEALKNELGMCGLGIKVESPFVMLGSTFSEQSRVLRVAN